VHLPHPIRSHLATPATLAAIAFAICTPTSLLAQPASAQPTARPSTQPPALTAFLDAHCIECHDDEVQKGDLNLLDASFDLSKPEAFKRWARVFERVEANEMPPAKKPRPDAAATTQFLDHLLDPLATEERRIRSVHGRSEIRRLNRIEYQNTLRDVLALPHLDLIDILPPEGSAYGFDKSAEALPFSHVHAKQLIEAADLALAKAVAPTVKRPPAKTIRFELAGPENLKRNCNGFYALLKQGKGVPMVGDKIDRTVTLVKGNFERREPGSATDTAPFFDGLAVFNHGPSNLGMAIRPFKIEHAGTYKIRVHAHGIYNDNGTIRPSERGETVGFYTDDRTLGHVDIGPEPATAELTVWLEPDERIMPLVSSAEFEKIRLVLPKGELLRYQHFRAHGVVYRWFELEGPLHKAWPPESHKRLFGKLPLRDNRDKDGQAEVLKPEATDKEVRRLLRTFMIRALRRPVLGKELELPVRTVMTKLRRGEAFQPAMLAGYRAALTSPDFLLMHRAPNAETPATPAAPATTKHTGVPLDGFGVAERLSYFLWNSPPDGTLRNLARSGELLEPATLRQQTERLLNDPRAGRFVDHFLDHWLVLKEIDLTQPDANLYPEYRPVLLDAMLAESRAYFSHMLREDLGVTLLVDSDFAMLNEALAELYEVPGVRGSAIRRVALPHDSVRGGMLTQAALLKTTANGTTTSPVVRGTYVLTHLLGDPPPPPPPTVPAVEPDITGATTIRQLLEQHRADSACAGCHAKIDPPGFALESFDVMGGFRRHYRTLEKGKPLGLFVDGKPAPTRSGLPVDPSGTLPGGSAFDDIHAFRKLLLQREDQLGRNLLQQLVVYATEAPVGFSDRAVLDQLQAEAKPSGYGLRSMIHLIVQSRLFLEK